MHSSKRLLVETLNSSYHLLGDAIINLTLAKGQLEHLLSTLATTLQQM